MNKNNGLKRLGHGFRLTLLAVLAGVLFYALPTIAAPYGPDGKGVDYRQPDGTTVKVKVFGDEFYAVAETEEGYTVVYDKNKVLTYGNLSADGKQIVSTGVRASNKPDHAVLQASGIKKNIRLNPEGRKEAVARGLQRMRADRKGRVTPESVQYYSDASTISVAPLSSSPSPESELPPPPPSYAPPTETRIGEYVGLCLLVDFSDQAGTIPRSAVDDYCNKPGYTNFSNAGSIYDYFFKQSGGRLQYNNIVTAYVRVPNPKTYYDDGVDGTWGNSKAQDLVRDALDVLMAQGFDFTQISRDGSGYIYSINVFYAGTCASGWSTGLWPSSWAIPTKTVDAANGIKAYSYQMTDMGTALDIGTFCHENGHMLMDYPDLYSYDGNAASIGTFSLMASSGSTHPVNIDPYLKEASGWMDIIDLSSSSHQRCTVQVDGNQLYRYLNPAKPTEYFVFEVRDNTGYEGPYGGASGSVNPSAGLVAYHVYETGSNPYSSIWTSSNPASMYTKPYELLLVEAAPPTTVTPWYDDPTPGSTDAFKSNGVSQISDITTPELKFWDATGRNTDSGCVIHSISADGPTMTFVIGAGDPPGAPSIVLSRTTIDSFCDYGGAALPQTFAIANGGGGTLSYTISDNQSWLSCAPTSGTASSESDTITVNFVTSNLVAGSYSATINVYDPLATPTNDTIIVNLTVNPQPILSLSTTNIVENGIAGEAGPQVSFAINNNGGGAMTYSVSKTQSWLTLSPASGTVVGETDTVYVNLSAATLAPGTYNDMITITAPGASNSVQTIAVTFSVNGDDIVVTAPNGGESVSANNVLNITWVSSIGGTVSVTLLKNGAIDSVITSSTTNDGIHSWTIPGSKSGADYTIRVTSQDASPGFSDESNGAFTILPPPIYAANMDSDPGWTLDTSWAYGQPTGGQQDTYGNPDPTSGYNGGTNVIGYRLDGDYEASLSATRWATTPAISCAGYTNVMLSFQRWLGVEQFQYDKAYIQVSNNGSTWSNIWQHVDIVNDSNWVLCEYDISAIADDQANVYVRWGIGVSDGSWQWCGWNLDEVKLTGDSSGPSIIVTKSGGSVDVTEGGATDTYTVELGAAPTHDVFIAITPDAEVSVNRTNLTFTTGNWASPQTVTVTAFDDSDHELSHIGTITHSSSSGDAAFNGIVIDDVLVSITDNDNNIPVVNAGDDQTVLMTGAVWLPTGVSLWLDADDASTVLLNGASVTNWLDKSGNGRHATQGTAANQPTDTASGLNGKHVVRFDGTTDYLNVNLDFLAGVSHSAFIVTKPTAYTDIYGAANASAGANSLHVGFANSTTYRMNFWGNDLSGTVSANFHAGDGNILNYVWITGAAKQILANGSSEGTSGAVAGSIGTMSGGGRISNIVGHGYFGGDIAELIMVTGTVSVATRESFEGYLAHKWGTEGYLPAGHTYKAESPSNAEATATLAGTATDADIDPLAILWSSVSGPASVAISNATSVNASVRFTKEGVYVLQLSASDSTTQVVDQVTITVTTNALPAAIIAPTGLTAVAVATNRINLAWSDNSTNETGFAIERSLTNGAGFTVIASTAANATNYADTGLSVGRTYYYRVYATNATDASAVTAQASATTPKMPATVTLGNLSQPYNGTARPVSVTTVPVGLTVGVTYNAVSTVPTNAGSYAVAATINEASYDGATNGTLVVSQATPTVTNWPTAAPIIAGQAVSNATLSGGSASVGGAFSYAVPSDVLPVGTNATVAVRFIPNDIVNYTTVPGTVAVVVTVAPPLAPTGLSAVMRVGQVDLSWTASSNAVSYKVKRATVSGGSYTLIGTPAGTSFSDMTVTNGSTYYYVVSAVNSGGETDSAEVEAALPQALPFAETFDGEGMASTIGTLNGQRGWTGGGNTLVQGGVGREGNNGLSITEDEAIQNFMNGTNTVTLGFWIKPVAGAEPKPAELPTNATAVIWVSTNDYVTVFSNATVVVLPVQSPSNQWSRFEVTVDYTASTWSLAVNGTNAASGLGLYSAQDRFRGVEVQNTASQPTYLDDISISSALAVLTAYENWLDNYFGTTSVDGSALSSNGVNTILESYIAGLDPTNPASRFAVMGIGDQAGASVLNWSSVSGRLYSVYWSSNLLGGAAGFQLISNNIPWNANTFTDAVHGADDAGFYRIDVQLE